MEIISNVANIVKLCVVVAVFAASPSYQRNLKELPSESLTSSTAAINERCALEHIGPINATQKDALDFVVESIENEADLDFKDKLVARISLWFVLREDLEASKFKQAYSRHVRDKCNQLRSTAVEQRDRADELSVQDFRKLNLKLVACGILLERSVQTRVRAVVTKCKRKNKLKYRQLSAPLLVLGGLGLNCCLGMAPARNALH